jgi:hypothetical protein
MMCDFFPGKPRRTTTMTPSESILLADTLNEITKLRDERNDLRTFIAESGNAAHYREWLELVQKQRARRILDEVHK